jgi:hypothetical protein
MDRAACRSPIGSVCASSNTDAVGNPRRRCQDSVDCRERRRFAVFQQRHDAFAVLRFQIDQTIDDGGRLRSAIDVVADKYERQRPALGVDFAMQQQAAQLVQTAVNIADGVSERHCNSLAVFGRRSFLMMAIFRHSRSVHVHQKMGTLARWGRLVFCEEPTLSR